MWIRLVRGVATEKGRYGAYAHRVITDLAMPDLSGWQLATAIRDLDAAVPIVLTSGWEPENLGDAMRQHHITFLRKPFTFAQIRPLVSEALSRRRTQPAHAITPTR